MKASVRTPPVMAYTTFSSTGFRDTNIPFAVWVVGRGAQFYG